MMASFGALMSVVSVGTGGWNINYPPRRRLGLNDNNNSLMKQHQHQHHNNNINEKMMMRSAVKVKVKVKVKAMGEGGGGGGIAKYKGTHMREKKLTEMIEKKVIEAKEVCEGDNKYSDECKVAWDEVEEVSQAKADLRRTLEKDQDPLESFCHDHPDIEECLIYHDY